MIDSSTWVVFLLAAITLFLSPGPNMAFVLSHGVAYGPRGGIAAAFGIAAADLVLTALTASGVMALFAAWPPSFDILRASGALYLLWLAIQAIRSPHAFSIACATRLSSMHIFRSAMLNSLLNPKALMFFIVFLPQFVVPANGRVMLHLVAFGCALAVAALAFNTALGVFSGQAGDFLRRRPWAVRYQGWLLGGVLVGLAMRLALLERPVSR